jgi:hypothetical protein
MKKYINISIAIWIVFYLLICILRLQKESNFIIENDIFGTISLIVILNTITAICCLFFSLLRKQ